MGCRVVSGCRYFLFAGKDYYPGGGWADFVDYYGSVEEAMKAGMSPKYDWMQVVDTQAVEVKRSLVVRLDLHEGKPRSYKP
jgi:hypothetical protein